MLVIENLVKNYKYFNAVDNLSLTISKSQIYGIVGPIGSGKTTLLKIAAGVLTPTSGKVTINGKDIYKRNSKKISIGYVPELTGYYDGLKVLEYMTFYSSLNGISTNDRSNIISQLLKLVDLTDKKEEFVGTLNLGKKKWLSLARALINNPQLLVLDEPASDLEPKEWLEMIEILKTLKDMGKSILVSSSNLSELSRLSTSIGVIQHGKLIASGSVDDVTKVTLKKQSKVIKGVE